MNIVFPEAKMQTISPTSQMRWLLRDGTKVLQQLWVTKNYADGRPISGGTDWRDVPIEDGK